MGGIPTSDRASPSPPPNLRGGTPSRKPGGSGDIIIAGAGLAGLFTALRLAPRLVTVVAAAPLGEGAASAWAQGGIAAAVGLGDTPEAHAADTIRAGHGLVDEHVAHLVASEAADRVRDLLGYGVPFDRDTAGRFILSREAAHGSNRIVRVSGDRAGAAIMGALVAAVRRTPSICVLEGFSAEALILETGRAVGVRLTGAAGAVHEFGPASAVVLATGGIGALYETTTNPHFARGEALAFAARAGALIADAEFVQFHPTAIDIGADPAPLATESLRGEGAVLVDRDGQRFMARQHADAELAPRDVVARAVFDEIAAGRGAFLDCREAIGSRFADAFPTVNGLCWAAGIDPARELIPVAPAAHYHMGGIATNHAGRTSIPGLWAVGEVASTGLHGANRLASNSLLEAVVFGSRAATDIASLSGGAAPGRADLRLIGRSRVDSDARAEAIGALRRLMSRYAGVVRDGPGLRYVMSTLAGIAGEARGDTLVANMALAARFLTGAALLRLESRGSHMRRDFPAIGTESARRSFLGITDIEEITERCLERRPVRQKKQAPDRLHA